MTKLRKTFFTLLALSTTSLLPSCGTGGGAISGRPGNLGPLPTPAVRSAQIANEEKGNFYYGRRYYVEKTRLWGYLRKPGQSYKSSKLVLINEDRKRQPDRLPENGSGNNRYGHDQNYEYKIYGSYTGRKAYDPNSNLFLPEFRLTNYQLINKNPGWIFNTNDYYDPTRVTLRSY